MSERARRMSEGLGAHELECASCGRVNAPDARFCAGCGLRLGRYFDAHGEHDLGADPLLGRTIADRYRIEELLGRGGMGVVYRVEHVRIGKLMAMKLLHGALARDRDVVKRFKREAEAASKLDHPHTVQVFDFGQSDGMTFLVMEYLSGRDLGQVLKEEGALSFDRVARIAVQVCGSVAQAHERGIVHRDLKPENIMVLDRASGRGAHARDVVKVLDFGLAKLRETEEAGEKSLTRAGAILGTPYYMAPEHIRGEAVDARSDVYAMGALMYKAITGEPPFSASSPVGVLTMHLTEEVLPPSRKRPGVPEDADRIVLRAMAKDPRDRFQSMEQLRAELSAYLAAIGDHEGIETVRVSRIGGGTLPTESGRQREVATRSDVDEYERSLRRRNIAGYAVALVLAAGLAAGGGWAWTQRPAPSATEESEPNNVLTQADALPEGQALQAYLGKRIDEERSDADFYAIRNAAGTPRPIRIEVSAIPNMDLVVELFREGISTPVLIAGSGGVGMAEIVPNFVIDGATYYLRVREVWESGAWPTENVSDPYTVRWFGVTLEENDERELNDSLELADTIGVPGIRRGYIGWGGDQDGYCLDEDAMDIVARVEAPSTLDLVLEVVDRAKGRVTTIDANGVGEGEESSVIASGAAGSLCFVVSARRPPGQPANDPDQRYVLRVERAAEPAPEGSP